MKNTTSRYAKSEALLKEATKLIPLGTQTFSKSQIHYPYGVSPFYAARAEGSHLWDVDGNEYIDFVNALAAITLGYNDTDVQTAVRAQLELGSIFSLPHELEISVAKLLTEMIPGAEMVRFGKNGSDATTGAIRLARAVTKRDRIAMCGYHGWHDWSIGTTTRNAGVPRATQELTHTFEYNNLNSLQRLFATHPGEFAAVILEPTNVTPPKPGFLEELKALTHQNGALLIFDETITGFRFANGGAQEYFGVVADLATFGKGLANGYPLSALTGSAKLMSHISEVFYSFTFGGETLSLAAAYSTLSKLRREPVIRHLWNTGEMVFQNTTKLIDEFKLGNTLAMAGFPCWSFLTIRDTTPYSAMEIKTLLLQELFSRGILSIGSHNMSYAHSKEEIGVLHQVYQEVFPILADAIKDKSLPRQLRCDTLKPLFRVR